MKMRCLFISALVVMLGFSGCSTSNRPVGQSQVRQAPQTSSTMGSPQPTQGSGNQSINQVNQETGDSSGLGTSGTGGRSSSLGSSGGSPYIPPTGGKQPANSATSKKPRHQS